MTIVLSETIKGKPTHWLKEEYKEKALNGEITLSSARLHLPIKPRGFWISWNHGWEKFCKYDYKEWMEKDKVCLRVKLKPGLRIWLIDSMDDFNSIWSKFPYGVADEKFLTSFSSLMKAQEKGHDFWSWLQETYAIDGVALTEAGQWRTRMDTWLYGWDCASIVIFNPENVELTPND